MNDKNYSLFIKTTAIDCGFDYCGIAKAEQLEDDARRLEKWLSKGLHGNMQYMENHFDLRIDPNLLVPGAKSVITLLNNYYPPDHQNPASPKISKYAYGQDYHEVIRKKLKAFMSLLQTELGNFQGRGFVDSAPVLERAWALKSGLGWIGKNGNLIHPKSGSFFFIATLIIDIPLQYDDPFAKDYCGTCTKCIDHCPTEAITPNKVIDGSKCISYFTIELKDALIPDSMKGKFDNWMFGCDTCQDVCPWNRFSQPNREESFTINEAILKFNVKDWDELTEAGFKEAFKHSPLKRSKYAGIRRNLTFLSDG